MTNSSRIGPPILAQVSPNFGKFTLFSVNKQITENAVSHQQIDDRSKIEIVEMVDYTGIGNRLEDMIDTSLSYDQMSDLIRGFQLGPVENGNPKQYDVVVSSCILSSIVNQLASVFGSLPKEHVGKLIKTIRDQHITQLLSHCKQGGKVLLYFSLMSAEMCPEIEKVKPEAFQALIADQLQKGIHYHGCSPLAIQLGLENDPEMFELIKDPRATMPWLWDAGAQRLAVMCIEFTKK